MNSSPFRTWDEFLSQEAIYTFFDSPWVIKAICAATLALVVWFIVSTYRFEGRGRDASGSGNGGSAETAE